MKKIFILLALLALSLGGFSCGGGGAGSADEPRGENPGIPSVVQLLSSHNIAQTNSENTLHAKVLDGNGIPVPNTTVRFSNLSAIGVLSPTDAITDGLGIATVKLKSTTSGFATVQAEVNTGVGLVRDRKTVYFTTQDVLAVTMSLDVDGAPFNGIYDESSDFILFENDNDDTIDILATVRDAGGIPLAGETVSWYSDHPEEVVFIREETITNVNGQAKAIVQVTPASIRATETHVNIMAYAGNGAATMITLFLQPVFISPTASYLTADPASVNTGKTSIITALVRLNTGALAPDGTTVNFTTTCGTIDPFAQTTNGEASATFTAPLSVPPEDKCTITGTSGGVIVGSVDVTVTTELEVIPSAQTINGAPGGTVTFTIIGGVAPYTVSTDKPLLFPPDPATVEKSGDAFEVNVNPNTPSGSVKYTVRDSVGDTVDATLTITYDSTDFYVLPASQTIPQGGSANFLIFGGTPPYQILVDRPGDVQITLHEDYSFTVVGINTATVKITVLDDNLRQALATLIIQ